MTMSQDVLPACHMTGPDLVARRQETLSGLLAKMREVEELVDGYALQFPPTDEVAQELLAFILVERQCCPFFQIELAFTPDNGPLWLRLRGEDEVKQFVKEELWSFTGTGQAE